MAKWKFMLIACLLSLSLQAIAQRDEIIVIEDPSKQADRFLKQPKGASYLIIVPRDFLPEILPLAKFRLRQQQVACVTVEAIRHSYPGRTETAIAHFLRDARSWPAPKLKYLLLAADANRIPPWSLRDYRGKFYSTDYPYGGNPPLLVGRLPAANARELKTMVAKTLRYEESTGGLWQRRVSFVAGEGGFGNVADALLEDIFTQLITSLLPGWSDITMSYANPNSDYFYPARLFPNIVASRLNEGSLFFVYIGHGSRDSLGKIYIRGRNYPIFRTRHLSLVKIPQGAPIVFSIACYTGDFDWVHDGLGEAMVKMEHGPVAFFGASQVSHPYGNILLGKALLEGAFEHGIHTTGELLLYARQQLLEPPAWDLRLLLLDQTIKYFAGDDLPLKQVRKDHVGMYNLLGDPALCIAFPKIIKFSARKNGKKLLIEGQAPGKEYRLLVTLEVPLNRIIDRKFFPLNFSKKDGEKQAMKYFQANYKVVASEKRIMNVKKFSITLPLDPKLPSGKYIIKVAILDSTGITVGYRIFNKSD